jgi:hypothetical protein
MFHKSPLTFGCLVIALCAGTVAGQEYTDTFDRERCTFSSTGSSAYFPLWPGLALTLEGEVEDDGEIVTEQVAITVLDETEMADGVETRVVEEYEAEDDEVTEISRNFMAVCRETGDVWYFGEDVDIYEDGEVVDHSGAWRAGENGARPGLLMLGTPVAGARFAQEVAPGVAEDRSEIVGLGRTLETSDGILTGLVEVLDTDALNPSSPGDPKLYAPGIGLVKDEELELVEVQLPDCVPDATTHCLQGGRFRVEVEWQDHDGNDGEGQAILGSSDSGEFWFFSPSNTELLVKVLDACAPPFEHYWVFAAGLTNVGVTLTVTDTHTEETRVYPNPVGSAYQPVLDTSAFDTCP